jgi:hypothetical protein
VSGTSELRGRVIDAGGAPIQGARIVIVASAVPMPEIALLSDEQGRFALRLPPGRFTLRAHGSGGSVGDLDVEGAPHAGEILIMLDR